MNAITRNTKALAQSLMHRGDTLAAESDIEAAEAIYVQGLILQPSNPLFLRKLGSLYEEIDRAEESLLCFRGVIPDAVNARYFDAEDISSRLVPSFESVTVRNRKVHAPEQHPLVTPVIHGSAQLRPQFKRTHTSCSGTYISFVDQGEVWFDRFNTIVLSKDREILSDHTKGNEFLAWRKTTTCSPTRLSGRACFLEARSSSIYYHWMLDVLPKIGILESAEISISEIDWFIVDSSKSFQRETLKTLGIPESKLVSPAQSPYFKSDELIVPYLKNDLGEKVYTGLGFGLGSWVPTFLRDAFAKAGAIPQKPRSRLYISRENANSRTVSNETQLVQLLNAHGFSSIDFDHLNIAEQAEVMGQADVVVTVHGAGLSNLIYCKPGTRLLEIFGNYIVPCYWSLANLCNLDYHQYFVNAPEIRSDEPAAKSIAHRRKSNLDIDIEEFGSILNEFLECELNTP